MDEHKDVNSTIIKVSIILPVFNAERYLPAAIDSVLKQSLTEFELILIDDGSTDSSGLICNEYAKKDARIRVIHKANEGVCSARNMGITSSRGEYIAFIDNDDEFLDNLLRDNYELAKKYRADIVKFNMEFLNINRQEKKVKSGTTKIPAFIFDKKNISKNYNLLKKGILTPWSGMYRRAFITCNELLYNTSFLGGYEDWEWLPRCYKKAEKIVFNEGVYYKYYIRANQSTSMKAHDTLTKMNNCVCAVTAEYHLFKDAFDMHPLCWQEVKLHALIQILSRAFTRGTSLTKHNVTEFLYTLSCEEGFSVKATGKELGELKQVNTAAPLFIGLLDRKKVSLLYYLAKYTVGIQIWLYKRA